MIGQGGDRLFDREMYDEAVIQFARHRGHRASPAEMLTRLRLN
jgi:hypothetical protein